MRTCAFGKTCRHTKESKNVSLPISSFNQKIGILVFDTKASSYFDWLRESSTKPQGRF